MLNLPVIPRQRKERVMKNVMCVLGLVVVTGCVGWSFGSGQLDTAAVTGAVVGWFAILIACIED
jgi:hypothetical protein